MRGASRHWALMRRTCGLLLLLLPTLAVAQQATPAGALTAEHCGRRLSMTLGLYWRTQALGAEPQARVRELLARPEVVRTFASFINSRFNDQPADRPEQDPGVAMVRYVLTNDLPWRDVFSGRVTFTGGGTPTVTADPAQPALGYFGSAAWLKRYQGNEPDGWLLTAAYRTLQNTTGLTLEPSPDNGGDDSATTGRERAACRSCHFDSPYALDAVARLLPVRQGSGGSAKVVKVPVTPQVLFNGLTVESHEQLVERLVTGDHFTFWSCRLAFEFVFGRPENACEAPLFEQCAAAFEQSGRMQDALATLLESPAFCGVTP